MKDKKRRGLHRVSVVSSLRGVAGSLKQKISWEKMLIIGREDHINKLTTK